MSILHIKNITEYHRLMQLPKPQHPLVSVINFADIKRKENITVSSFTHGYYSIALKQVFNGKMKYGQQEYYSLIQNDFINVNLSLEKNRAIEYLSNSKHF
jgi:hypothetical protein